MPIYIEISSLHRTVTIVARGRISPDEIRGAARQMLEARVPHYSKLIDVSGGTTEFTPEQVETLAALFRGSADRKLGAVAFPVDPERGAFARAAAATKEAVSGRSGCSPACARRASGWPVRIPSPRRRPLLPRRLRPFRRLTASRAPIRSARR